MLLMLAYFYIISIIISPLICTTNLTKLTNSNRDHFLSSHTIMAVFSPITRAPGPCKYFQATRKQNHQCRKDIGLPLAISEAKKLALTYCEELFRYDRWNCSIELRGKRNIFKKFYKETAFVTALTAAAVTHSISKKCSEGKMEKCTCGGQKNTDARKFQYYGCHDNIKYGKRMARQFLDIRKFQDGEVSELMKHDSEIGIATVASTMKDKCKCHGVSGSCSMKTCWKKLPDFNETARILRQKYHQAIRKPTSNRTSRRAIINKKKQKNNNSIQNSTLYYLDTSPTFCSVTKGRRCLNTNCATLCCGRGYVTKIEKQIEKCRCRFKNGKCCQVICDHCVKYEDRFYCK